MKQSLFMRTLASACLAAGLGCGGGGATSNPNPPAPQTSPAHIKTAPANGAQNVSPSAHVSVSFSQPLDPSSINPEALQVRDQSGNRVPGLVSLEDFNSTVTFTPVNALRADEAYLFSLPGSVKDLQGRSIEPVQAGFKTGSLKSDPASGAQKSVYPIVISNGYTFRDNTMPGGPVFSYEDISATGTNLPSIHSDDATVNVPLPFPVTFYDVSYGSMFVGSNGYITFGSGDSDYSNYSFPASGQPRIAPFFDDLYPNSTSMILWEVRGSAPNRRLIVQWHDISHFAGSGHIDFQVLLYENRRDILFQYQNSSNFSYPNGSSATVGLNKGDGVEATQYSYNTSSLADGRAILFSNPLSFTDDYGRSRFCAYPETGFFTWTILSGPGAGSSFVGQAIVKNVTLGGFSYLQFRNKLGDPYTLNFSFNKTLLAASGYYVIPQSVSSYLADSFTSDDPPGCGAFLTSK